LNSVLMGGLIAAGLMGLMIFLFLGNWRLTLIILATIPISIITAILVLFVGGQTLNTMTLGGFALAVGILVDNSTVVIENIERRVKDGDLLQQAIVSGSGEAFARHNLAACIKAGLAIQGYEVGDPIAPQPALTADERQAVEAVLRDIGSG
jgi:predicted RND superfamily exporter protein